MAKTVLFVIVLVLLGIAEWWWVNVLIANRAWSGERDYEPRPENVVSEDDL